MKSGLTLFFLLCVLAGISQDIPYREQNVDFLVTFGPAAEKSWGDDDFSQVYFISIDEEETSPFYIRIFDPETGGQNDQRNGSFDSKCKFRVFGGKGAHSHPDAVKTDPVGKYDSGIKLAEASFGNESKYDGKWYTMGPFNPREGEFNEKYGYVFKIICDGVSGDDGNAYRYFISRSATKNQELPQMSSFAYEVSFRLSPEAKSTALFYPFIDKDVISVKQHNFDFDDDGYLRLTSQIKNRHNVPGSGNGRWASDKHKIFEEEQGKFLLLTVFKQSSTSNDMVIYMENQYKNAVPFFSQPVGDVPRYQYKLKWEEVR